MIMIQGAFSTLDNVAEYQHAVSTLLCILLIILGNHHADASPVLVNFIILKFIV